MSKCEELSEIQRVEQVFVGDSFDWFVFIKYLSRSDFKKEPKT